jgi:hypothetical protein
MVYGSCCSDYLLVVYVISTTALRTFIFLPSMLHCIVVLWGCIAVELIEYSLKYLNIHLAIGYHLI